MTTRSVIGVDTASGTVLWEFPFDDEWNENIVTPVATADGRDRVRRASGHAAADDREVRKHVDGDGGVAHAGRRDVYELAGARARNALRPFVEAQGTVRGHGCRKRARSSGRPKGRNATSASVVAAGTHLVFLTTESQMIVTAGRSGRVPRGAALHRGAEHDLRAADRLARPGDRARRVARDVSGRCGRMTVPRADRFDACRDARRPIVAVAAALHARSPVPQAPARRRFASSSSATA